MLTFTVFLVEAKESALGIMLLAAPSEILILVQTS
jgi:hypothetical protein